MLRKWILTLLLTGAAGCSGTYQIHVEELSALFQPVESLTLDEVRQADTDILSILYDGRVYDTAALAFIEHSSRKWMSSKGLLLIENNGRWIRTFGVGTQLIHSQESQADPLASPSSIRNGTEWVRTVDWNDGHYGHSLRSTFGPSEATSIDLFDQTIPVNVITESIVVSGDKGGVFHDKSWTNQYWFHAESGELLKSQQRLHPNDAALTSVYLSRAARHLSQ